MDGSKKRFDSLGEIRWMVACDGYVMVRRPGGVPFVMTRKEWASLPTVHGRTVHSEY